MKNNPIEELNQSEWDGFIFSILKPYIKYSLVSKTDLQQEAWVGLLTAAERYNPNLGTKFSTYAYHYIKGCIRKKIRESMKNSSNESECSEEFREYTDTSVDQQDTIDVILDSIKHEKYKDIFIDHVFNSKSCRQIAKETGVSHETIAKRVNTLTDKIRKRVNRENSIIN